MRFLQCKNNEYKNDPGENKTLTKFHCWFYYFETFFFYFSAYFMYAYRVVKSVLRVRRLKFRQSELCVYVRIMYLVLKAWNHLLIVANSCSSYTVYLILRVSNSFESIYHAPPKYKYNKTRIWLFMFFN